MIFSILEEEMLSIYLLFIIIIIIYFFLERKGECEQDEDGQERLLRTVH